MRPETKQKLDRLERRDRRAKFGLMVFVLAASMLLAGGLAAAYSPGEHLRDVDAIVAQSAVGANEFGQPFHVLRVRLKDGRTASVKTHVKSPIRPGKKITLELRQTFYGSQYYLWNP